MMFLKFFSIWFFRRVVHWARQGTTTKATRAVMFPVLFFVTRNVTQINIRAQMTWVSALDAIARTDWGSLYWPDSWIFGQSGAGNNWAKGSWILKALTMYDFECSCYFEEGGRLTDSIIHFIRKQVENSEGAIRLDDSPFQTGLQILFYANNYFQFVLSAESYENSPLPYRAGLV